MARLLLLVGRPSALSEREAVRWMHVDVTEDASDVRVAETFLHDRVLIVPVRGDGGLKGVITPK